MIIQLLQTSMGLLHETKQRKTVQEDTATSCIRSCYSWSNMAELTGYLTSLLNIARCINLDHNRDFAEFQIREVRYIALSLLT
jgi:hypothetical protein